jgi:hypothetical protein
VRIVKILIVGPMVGLFLLWAFFVDNHIYEDEEEPAPSEIIPHYSPTNFEQPVGFASLEKVHNYGLAHKAVWVNVLNSNYQVLLLRRAGNLRTCPGRLSLLGEHESQEDQLHGKFGEPTARRGLKEEVLRPDDLYKAPIKHLFTSLLTISTGGRVDVQQTWFGYVVYDKPIASVVLNATEALPYAKFYDLGEAFRLVELHSYKFCLPDHRDTLYLKSWALLCKKYQTPSCEKVLKRVQLFDVETDY